jgi:predicted Zn-dependent protease
MPRVQHILCRSLCCLLLSAAVSWPQPTLAADIELPVLGDSASGIVSKQQEHMIGRSWLKAFRSRINEHQDPLLKQYLEQLLYNLATFSELEDPRLELVIVNNPTMNAFAVPGGVVGVHTGLFSFAETEDQLSSVLAHELAHLSQRHFARGLAERRKYSTLSMGGLLAGLVIAATVGGDAGTAALTVTQATAMDGQLRYSRANEQEADRIGLQALQSAGRNPAAAAEMFENMLVITRHSNNRPPEFLLTHPVTERRIADARNRVMGAPLRHYPTSEEYHLMRSRSLVALSSEPASLIKNFQLKIDQRHRQREAQLYGLALAHIANKDYPRARRVIDQLMAENPDQLIFRHTDVEIDIAFDNVDGALRKLERLLAVNPDNYPLTVLQSDALWQARRFEESSKVLRALSRQRSEDPNIWYRLAEVSGLAGDISGVHRARAEYFVLVGAFDLARKQLAKAASLVASDFKQSAIVRQRLRDLADMEDRVVKL